MKKLIIIFGVFVFFQLFSKGYSQDFLNINFSGEQDAQVNPARVISTEGNNYLLYDKDNSSNPSNPYIGITKIDNSTKQVLFDIRFDLSNNTDNGLSHLIHGIDIETYLNSIYVLASINSRDILLIQVDKSTGALIKKDIIPVANYFSNFTPIDLFFGKSAIDTDPYISILGKTGSGNGYNNKLQLLYKSISAPIFNMATFNYPGFSDLLNPKINSFFGDKVQISSGAWYGDIKLLEYNITTGQIEQNYNLYIDGGHKIEGLTYFNWDAIGFFMGQLTYNYGNVVYWSDMFFFRIDDFQYSSKPIFTFNNPNFKLVKADSHTNEGDFSPWGHVNGGTVSTLGPSFSGLYYEPSDPTHPRYAVGRFDATYYTGAPGGFTANTYTLRNMGGASFSDPAFVPNVSQVFGSSIFDGLSNNTVSGIFYRKPTGLNDKSNAYYLQEMTGPSTCSNAIEFTRTRVGSELRVHKQHNVDAITPSVQTISPSDLVINQTSYNPGLISNICIEPLTNSVPPPPPPVPCEPGYPCWEILPWNQSTKKSDVRATEESNGFEVRISPNPIINQIFVTSEKPIKTVLVYDASGKAIASRTGLNQKQVMMKVENIKPGTYFAKVTKADGTVAIKTLIKL